MKAKVCGGSCLAENKLSTCFSANPPGRARYLATNIFDLTGIMRFISGIYHELGKNTKLELQMKVLNIVLFRKFRTR